MSLTRLLYYSALISAWAAFLGWGVSESIRSMIHIDDAASSTAHLFLWALLIAVTAGTIGATVGLGLNVLGGMANGQWRQLARRALPGLLCGCAGGIVGAAVGGLVFYAYDSKTVWWRGLCWAIFGLGIGAAEGVYDRSFRKFRNGLLGGAVGGFVGGLLFNEICTLKWTETGAFGRAAGFVVLGLSIGAAIGLAHVVFRTAWLTVVDGFRTGRQLNITQRVTALGRGDHVPLPFLGPGNADLDAEHAVIRRMPDGSYCLEDNHSRLGTRLNGLPLTGATPLNDGDVIRLGTNLVRFNQRRRQRGEAVLPAAAGAITVAPAAIVPVANAVPVPPRPPASPPPAPASPSLPTPPPPPPVKKSSADKVFAPEPRPWLAKPKPPK